MGSQYSEFYQKIIEFFSTTVTGVVLVVFLVVAAVLFLTALAVAVLKAYAVYRLSTKCGGRYAWLAWLSLLFQPLAAYVLTDIPGSKPFNFVGIYRFKNRINAFWTYIIVYLCTGVVTGIISAFSAIPVIGWIIAAVVSLIPLAVLVFNVLYVYVMYKDVLETFKPGCPSNTAVAVCSIFVPFMWLIVMFTLFKYEPVIAVPYTEQTGGSAPY